MAILCLLLGLLCVAGFGSSQDVTQSTGTTKPSTGTSIPPTTTAVTTKPTDAANPPTTVTASSQPSTVTASSQPSTVATTAAATATISGALSAAAATTATPANTSPSSLPHVPTTTSATPSETTNNPSNGATTKPSRTTSAPATTLTESSSKVPTQATVPEKVKTTGTSTVTTGNNLISSPTSPSKGTEGTGTTETSKINLIQDSNSTSSPTATKPPPQSLDTKPTKDTDRSTPALGSTASPTPRMTSSTIAGEHLVPVTTKSVTSHPPSSSSSVPAKSPELTTHEDIVSQMTTEVYKAKKLQEKNIEVNCSDVTNENSIQYVKLAKGGSAICDGPTEDFNVMLMPVCKAIKPGFQENQDKCIVRLGRMKENDVLFITEAIVESRLEPKELYAQIRRNGANSNLFSFGGAEAEDEDVVSIPLISAIVSLAVLLLIIAAAYGCWHQRKARKREQRLTEELQTMENGYHDNPTLEVMETSPEMQEKKGGPNGELGDSWIVPLDNLTREDLEEEEDTHL